MGQIPIVEFLTFQVVAVLPRLQIAGLDAGGLKELLVSHSKSLTDRLGNNLSLDGKKIDSGFNIVVVTIHLLGDSPSHQCGNFLNDLPSIFIHTNKSK